MQSSGASRNAAVTERIISLVDILIVSAINAVIAIVSTAIATAVVADDRDGCVSSQAMRLLRREIAPSSHNLWTAGALAPIEASGAGSVKEN